MKYGKIHQYSSSNENLGISKFVSHILPNMKIEMILNFPIAVLKSTFL